MKEKIDVKFDYDKTNVKSQLAQIKKILTGNKEATLNIIIDASKKNDIDSLISMFQNFRNSNIDASLTVFYKQDYVEDQKELDFLLDLQKRCQELGLTANIQLDKITCNGKIENYFVAKSKVEKFVNKINNVTINQNGKEQLLSPAEKLVAIYFYTANRVYKRGDFYDDRQRNWIGLLTSNYAICSGFASLFKFVCDRVFSNDEVICEQQSISVYDNQTHKTTHFHSNNLLFLKDKKYDLDGIYYVDAQAGCKKEKDDYPHFVYSMMPLKKVFSSKNLIPLFQNNNFICDKFYSEEQNSKRPAITQKNSKIIQKLYELSMMEKSDLIQISKMDDYSININDIIKDIDLKLKNNEKVDLAIINKFKDFSEKYVDVPEIPKQALNIGLKAVGKLNGLDDREQLEFSQVILNQMYTDEKSKFTITSDNRELNGNDNTESTEKIELSL